MKSYLLGGEPWVSSSKKAGSTRLGREAWQGCGIGKVGEVRVDAENKLLNLVEAKPWVVESQGGCCQGRKKRTGAVGGLPLGFARFSVEVIEGLN